MTTYKIDTVTANIVKVKGGYEVTSFSVTLDREFQNDSLVSNVAKFKTVKECKQHADMISCCGNMGR